MDIFILIIMAIIGLAFAFIMPVDDDDDISPPRTIDDEVKPKPKKKENKLEKYT